MHKQAGIAWNANLARVWGRVLGFVRCLEYGVARSACKILIR